MPRDAGYAPGLPSFRRPADKAISAGNSVRSGGKGKAGQELFSRKGQILDMLTNYFRVTEVVELMYQAVKKPFLW